MQCSDEVDLCKAQRLAAFPEIRLFLPKSPKSPNPGFIDYEGDDRRTGALAAWFAKFIGHVEEVESDDDWTKVESQKRNIVKQTNS